MKTTQRGLTLIELMVALTIAIILLAVGIPAFQGIQANSQAAAQANSLVTAFNLARSEAVGRGLPLAVCAKNVRLADDPNDVDCGTDAANDWKKGWQVFADPANAGVHDSGEDVIKAFDAPRGTPTIVGRDSNGTALLAVRFNSRGESTGLVTCFQLTQTGTTAAEQVRCVRLAPSGQITTTRLPCPSPCQ